MLKKIGPFQIYNKKPCSLKYGELYFLKLDFEEAKKEKTRTIRVWIPPKYDENKEYPVIYMSDGQNLFDKYTSAFGSWQMDQVLHKIKRDIIVVGIDCPHDFIERHNELCPPYEQDKIFENEPRPEPCGDIYLDFLMNKVKPLIEQYFKVKKEKEYTAIGGSSMGGLMAFYGATKLKEVFGVGLCFSPAFFLYNKKHLKEGLKQWNPKPSCSSRYFFFVGGKDFERELMDDTINVFHFLEKKKFDNKQNYLIVDSILTHHESSWNKYLADAINWWLEDLD